MTDCREVKFHMSGKCYTGSDSDSVNGDYRLSRGKVSHDGFTCRVNATQAVTVTVSTVTTDCREVKFHMTGKCYSGSDSDSVNGDYRLSRGKVSHDG
ncbi:hypothetical protein J6590_027665 [Homalodisca vitripennis]|nr:hypothetical protein J6590_027665 [Homalodisca vitripennis]